MSHKLLSSQKGKINAQMAFDEDSMVLDLAGWVRYCYAPLGWSNRKIHVILQMVGLHVTSLSLYMVSYLVGFTKRRHLYNTFHGFEGYYI